MKENKDGVLAQNKSYIKKARFVISNHFAR